MWRLSLTKLRRAVVGARAWAAGVGLVLALAACGSESTLVTPTDASLTTTPGTTAPTAAVTTTVSEATSTTAVTATAPTTTTASAPTTTAASDTTTTITTSDTTTTVDTTTTTTTTLAENLGQLIELELVGGNLVGGARTEKVSLGGHVTIRVTGDSDDEVHIHGYDIFIHLQEGEGELSFIADIPGVFEIELEGSHQLLVNLEVS